VAHDREICAWSPFEYTIIGVTRPSANSPWGAYDRYPARRPASGPSGPFVGAKALGLDPCESRSEASKFICVPSTICQMCGCRAKAAPPSVGRRFVNSKRLRFLLAALLAEEKPMNCRVVAAHELVDEFPWRHGKSLCPNDMTSRWYPTQARFRLRYDSVILNTHLFGELALRQPPGFPQFFQPASEDATQFDTLV
jgi:hypothetical protein